MQKNASNIVVKTVCELNIWVKNYDEKTSVKNHFFCSLSPSHLASHAGHKAALQQSTRDTRDTGRGAPGWPGLPIVIGSLGLPLVLLYYIYIYDRANLYPGYGITIPYSSQPPSPTRAHPKRAQRRFFLGGAPLPVSARASHLGWRWWLPHDPPLSRHRFFFVTHAEMGGPGPSIQFGSPFLVLLGFLFFWTWIFYLHVGVRSCFIFCSLFFLREGR
jgi:hypothetical protein